MRITRAILTASLLIIPTSGTLTAQQNSANGEPGVYQVRTNFYMLSGFGGNIGVQTESDGVLLVDTGSAPASAKVLETNRKLSPQPIRYIINTSADSDHAGGNEALARAGVGLGVQG